MCTEGESKWHMQFAPTVHQLGKTSPRPIFQGHLHVMYLFEIFHVIVSWLVTVPFNNLSTSELPNPTTDLRVLLPQVIIMVTTD